MSSTIRERIEKMGQTNLWHDEDAVSPVIGVILMVAITVILAAVVAAFVFGVVGQPQAAPQASLNIEDADASVGTGNTDNLVTVEHYGGDDINISDTNFQITVRGTSYSSDDGELSIEDTGTDLTVGESIILSEDTTAITAGTNSTTVKLIDNPSDKLIIDTDVRVQ